MYGAIASSSVGPIDIWEILVGLNVALTALLKWRQKQNHDVAKEQRTALLARVTELESKQ
jgi:hypothetical protein